MITRPAPRIWLMTTAAFVLTLGSQVAQAQTSYQAGAPTMVAAAPSFPTIPAEQIARDVTSTFNPRTGEKELIAAPFDAFEEDPSLAGSVKLRSAGSAVAIDGRRLPDGALLEVDFYYNSPSDDPYGGRGYGDVSFVNGELAPVVLRDSRILECSTRVDNVVYDHVSYYDRSPLIGLYRPYRHYAGHSGFGFGFGNNYFGPGYGYYGRNYSRRSHYGGSRSSRPGIHRRVLDAVGGADRRDDRRDGRRANIGADRNGSRETPRTIRPRQSERQVRDRLSRIESYGVGTSRNSNNAATRNNGPMRGVNPRQRLEMGTPPSQSNSPTRSWTEPRRANRRAATPRAAAPRTQTPRVETPRAAAQPRAESRPAPRRSEPRRQTRSQPRSERAAPPKRPTRTAPNPRRSPSNMTRRQLDFFPNDGYGGRDIVTTRSVDCAREDKLRVFIPAERLDAARFDGLTVIALDAQGGETPIYLPPNYIEGFRLASSGQIRPQGYTSRPSQTDASQYSPAPSRVIESAPCPAGTSKQSDGTCLQLGTGAYPN